MKNLKFFLLLIIGFAFSNVQSQTFENPYNYIGEDHNAGMKFLLENLKSIPAKGEIKSTVVNILKSKYPSADYVASFNSFPDNPSNEDLRREIENCVSSSFYNEVLKVRDIILSGNNLSGMLTNLNEKERNASSLFGGAELDQYLMSIAVAKHSAIFWMPKSQGGENGISYFKGENISNEGGKQSFEEKYSFKSYRIDWGKVVISDYWGCLVGGCATATPAGALGGALMGSGMSVISQY